MLCKDLGAVETTSESPPERAKEDESEAAYRKSMQLKKRQAAHASLEIKNEANASSAMRWRINWDSDR
jgi:hypothetical protein